MNSILSFAVPLISFECLHAMRIGFCHEHKKKITLSADNLLEYQLLWNEKKRFNFIQDPITTLSFKSKSRSSQISLVTSEFIKK